MKVNDAIVFDEMVICPGVILRHIRVGISIRDAGYNGMLPQKEDGVDKKRGCLGLLCRALAG